MTTTEGKTQGYSKIMTGNGLFLGQPPSHALLWVSLSAARNPISKWDFSIPALVTLFLSNHLQRPTPVVISDKYYGISI